MFYCVFVCLLDVLNEYQTKDWDSADSPPGFLFPWCLSQRGALTKVASFGKASMAEVQVDT